MTIPLYPLFSAPGNHHSTFFIYKFDYVFYHIVFVICVGLVDGLSAFSNSLLFSCIAYTIISGLFFFFQTSEMY